MTADDTDLNRQSTSASRAMHPVMLGAIAQRHNLTLQEARERFDRYVGDRRDCQASFKRVMRGQVPADWGMEKAIESIEAQIDQGCQWGMQPQVVAAERLRRGDFVVIADSVASPLPRTDRLRQLESVLGSIDLRPTNIFLPEMVTRALAVDFPAEGFPPERSQPQPCSGCRHYDGTAYGGNPLICAMHPYGVNEDEETCADWEAVEVICQPND